MKIIFLRVREHIVHLIEAVKAPGVKPNEQRTTLSLRLKEKRGLDCAVKARYYLYFGFGKAHFPLLRVLNFVFIYSNTREGYFTSYF